MNLSQSFHFLVQALTYGPGAVIGFVVLVVVLATARRILTAGYQSAKRPLPEFHPRPYQPGMRDRTVW